MIPVTGLCLLVLTFVNSVLFVELAKVQRLGCLTLFNRIIYILRYTVFKVRMYPIIDRGLSAVPRRKANQMHTLLQRLSRALANLSKYFIFCQDSVEIKGFEPLTPCLQGRCSPN